MGVQKPHKGSMDPHTRASLQTQMVLTELMDIPKQNTTESTHKQGTAQKLALPIVVAHVAPDQTSPKQIGPERQLWPPVLANNQHCVVLPHKHPTAMAHSAQDSIPFADPANGGPIAVLAAALNNKLDRIAQRFNHIV